jgi:hypothetical protein
MITYGKLVEEFEMHNQDQISCVVTVQMVYWLYLLREMFGHVSFPGG